MQNELAKAQERVGLFEARQREIGEQLADLKAQVIDSEAVARALAEFDELWSVLLVRERERILKLLIDRIDYDGRDQQLAITWRLSGLGQYAAEVAP